MTTGGGRITAVTPQLRTTDIAKSIDFYTRKLGFALEFLHDDFYAGIRAGDSIFHLKLVDDADPSIEYVDHGDHLHLYFQTTDVAAVARSLKERGVRLERDVHETAWATRECVVKDDQGHTLYFGEPR